MADPEQVLAGHVLLAEDDPVSQAVASAMLVNLGFEVDVVADGAEAVTAATRNHYDAILLDCQLPILDGYEATTEIRRVQEGSRRTPIIAVTATPLRSGQERSLDAGMDDYLTKPYTLQGLAAVLARWAPDRSLRSGAIDPPKALPTVRTPVTDHGDTSRPVLDPAIVDRLQRLGDAAGEDLRAQLSDLFLADARLRVAALREALDRDDAAAAARSAHMLSGASANLGASELARLCAAFERDSAAGDLILGRVQLEAVEAELLRVRAALRSPARAP
jgi:CheY-like chemotaxis protein/HPt (histidine-containing phosphotransfer) domain-containing protein